MSDRGAGRAVGGAARSEDRTGTGRRRGFAEGTTTGGWWSQGRRRRAGEVGGGVGPLERGVVSRDGGPVVVVPRNSGAVGRGRGWRRGR